MANLVLLSKDEIRKHEVFSGSDEDWIGWSFALEAMLAENGMKDLLDAAKNHQGQLDLATMNADAIAVACNLYSLFAQRTRSKTQTITRLHAADSNGLECWRCFWEEHRHA